ncbi:MBL fold metallo-hydrolase [Leifsonia sp. NPDC058194]|uniref:MBL fold metallo-hydrolase n=1 Tax=Leifsonia sp. NPDC058194 TaxID=3346374 RepID=UPI0036DF1921
MLAGFSTHPHWDHLLWHPAFGTPPRYGTALAATTARERLAGGIDGRRFGIPEDTPLDLLGDLTALPDAAARIPWDGPELRIVEHRAHAPGHAALLIEESGVLVAGDMLSDVLIPMLDLSGAADPIGDYLGALDLLERAAGDATAVIPGHGSVGGVGQVRARIAADRAYVDALRSCREPDDSRIGPAAAPGWEWVGEVHARQRDRLQQLG